MYVFFPSSFLGLNLIIQMSLLSYRCNSSILSSVDNVVAAINMFPFLSTMIFPGSSILLPPNALLLSISPSLEIDINQMSELPFLSSINGSEEDVPPSIYNNFL